jgi:hypothetical protein
MATIGDSGSLLVIANKRHMLLSFLNSRPAPDRAAET